MPVRLNHTIVYCRDKRDSSTFLSEILGLSHPTSYGPFAVVQVTNDVSLDFLEEGPVHPQHYAFLLSDDHFDRAMATIRAERREHWADPQRRQPGRTNTEHGGRGVYLLDPSGHYVELLTRPYV